MWIRDKRDGVYDAADDDNVFVCESCEEFTEEIFEIKCGHKICVDCIGSFANDYDDNGDVIYTVSHTISNRQLSYFLLTID